jgi:archaellum component FlaD/FlaE
VTHPWPAGDWAPCYVATAQKKASAVAQGLTEAGFAAVLEKRAKLHVVLIPTDPGAWVAALRWLRANRHYRPVRL